MNMHTVVREGRAVQTRVEGCDVLFHRVATETQRQK